MFNIFDERCTIFFSSSLEYSSKRLIIPNLSLSGDVRRPALVVAPISVNFERSRRIERALGPFQ